MSEQTKDEVRSAIREQYGSVTSAARASACLPACCGPSPCGPGPGHSLALGYSEEDLAAAPGANMGLGCGNPQAIAALRPGEVVVDLGAGGGFDCFLAAKQVGPTGRVIGVDMTAEMVSKARANAAQLNANTVEFRLGEIEHLPVADGSADVVLSNCVINLSPDKAAVFRDAFRVLKPGGRLAIADVVATSTVPPSLASVMSTLAGCISGAATAQATLELLRDAGFANIRVEVNEESHVFIRDWVPGSGAERYIASATIEAVKPEATTSCCARGDG